MRYSHPSHIGLDSTLNMSDPTPASPDILKRRLHCSRLVEAREAIEAIRYVRNRPAVKQGQDLCLEPKWLRYPDVSQKYDTYEMPHAMYF
jgi:hypothetical protein